jgi:hypothetical protein
MKRKREDISPEEATMNKRALWVLIVGILLMVLLPFLFTRPWGLLVLTETGSIGDSIGGMTAPAIGLMSAALIFLSFQAQIRMNERQWNEIKKQQNIKNNDFAIEMVSEITNCFKDKYYVFSLLKNDEVEYYLEIIKSMNLDEIKDVFENKLASNYFSNLIIQLNPFIEIVELHENNKLTRNTYVKIGYALLKNQDVIRELLNSLEKFKFDDYGFKESIIKTNEYVLDIKKVFDKIYSIRIFLNDLHRIMMKSIE